MITETPNYAREICGSDILGVPEKCAENGFGPAVNRRVVGSSPTCGAISGEGRWNLFPAAFSFWRAGSVRRSLVLRFWKLYFGLVVSHFQHLKMTHYLFDGSFMILSYPIGASMLLWVCVLTLACSALRAHQRTSRSGSDRQLPIPLRRL